MEIHIFAGQSNTSGRAMNVEKRETVPVEAGVVFDDNNGRGDGDGGCLPVQVPAFGTSITTKAQGISPNPINTNENKPTTSNTKLLNPTLLKMGLTPPPPTSSTSAFTKNAKTAPPRPPTSLQSSLVSNPNVIPQQQQQQQQTQNPQINPTQQQQNHIDGRTTLSF